MYKNTFKGLIILLLCITCTNTFAQTKITTEDIWKTNKFSPKDVPGFNFLSDGKNYTQLKSGSIFGYDIVTGNKSMTILDKADLNTELTGFKEFTLSPDENKILLSTDKEQIYRHSSKANYYVWDKLAKSATKLSDGPKQLYPTFSPTNDKVAFIADNNLYYKDLKSGKQITITTDGKKNSIINGLPDWVYEEEFAMERAFEWSPDGKYLAYLRFDETKVPEYTIDFWKDEAYPEKYTYKYPKVGMDNAIVSVYIYSLDTKKTKKVSLTKNDEDYIPRLKWTQAPYKLCISLMNRHQNELSLNLADPETANVTTLMTETNAAYIEIGDDLNFLKNGKEYIWTSEKDGYYHIYLYDMNGKLVRQLTKGNWDVTALYGVDEKHGFVYFQAAIKSPMDRQVYKIPIAGGEIKAMTNAPGNNAIEFSSSFEYYTLKYSNINRPPMYTVYDLAGKRVRDIESNNGVIDLQVEYKVENIDFFQFTTSENVKLNGWVMKPSKLDPRQKYPVFMYQYSGPNSQQVTDSWIGSNYWWFQMLVQNGYIVACVDGRGTGARGEAFRKITYQQMGHYETLDQIEAAKYYKTLGYVDPDRIGIFGWSYGAYMSSLCILKGADVFKAAIAVAPVTNWKWYDSIYTERYMRTDKENPNGYHDNSPIYFADKLKGKYLLVHGCADDNVHFQNSIEMAKALIDANKQFDTYYYPNKNHGISGGVTRLHLYNKMTNFIYNNL